MCCIKCRFFDECEEKTTQKTPLEINEGVEEAFKRYQVLD